MGFLNQLLKYKNICIQCHNSPDADALAAAYGVYTYLKLQDINVSIIYSGDYEIQKKDLLYMIDICEIPVEYVKELPKTDLLLLVDGQYGRGNVYRFEADNIAMIDHHMPSMKKTENAFIDYSYQSCSTIVWELLKEEGYDVKANDFKRLYLRKLCRMGNCRHYQRENGKNHEIKKETVVYKKGSKPLFLSIMMLEFPVLIEFYG